VDFAFLVVCLIVIPVVINKSTEGRFEGIKPHLREIWTALAAFFSPYFLWKPAALEVAVQARQQFSSPLSYIAVWIIGGLLFCGYYWFAGKMFPPGGSAKPAPVAVAQTPDLAAELTRRQLQIAEEELNLKYAPQIEVEPLDTPERVSFINRGSTNLFLHDAKIGEWTVGIENPPSLIAPGSRYVFWTGQEIENTLKKVGPATEASVPVMLFIKNARAQEYLVTCNLVTKGTPMSHWVSARALRVEHKKWSGKRPQ
jgi:hypothetical protein